MKKYIKNSMLICAIALGVMACSKDEIDTFSGADLLYFQWSVDGVDNQQSQRIDSLSVSFAYELPSVTDSIFNIPVKVMGNVSAANREFKIELLFSTAVEGVDFVLPDGLTILANEINAMVPITLLRTPEMKQNPLSINIGLVPSENFRTDYYGTTENENSDDLIKHDKFQISVSDILEEPALWSQFAIYYLGDFSTKKLILYAEINEIPIPNWCCEYPDIGVFFGRLSILKAYLINQENNGTPVLEDDGTEMKLGPFA